jgi:P4 family phage/plasmid primase-like protien
MKLNEFLEQFRVSKNTIEKPITHTSMNGGKWHIPEKFIQSFYKKIVKYIINTGDNLQLVERMNDLHPLVIDIDIKYDHEFNDRQYTKDTVFRIVSFLWLNLSSLLDISENKEFAEIWVMEKESPYPCKTNKKYKTKDGIHIVFPNIIIQKTSYRKIMDILKEQNAVKTIFEDTCENPPSNEEDTLLDGCFSGWQPYGCSKDGESYYKVTEVYRSEDNINLEPVPKEIFQELYTNPLTIMKKLSMVGHTEENIQYSEELKCILDNRLKNTTSSSSSAMTNNIYGGANAYYVDHNDVINPYEIVENNEKELIKGLVSCLSIERYTEYSKWLAVGMCLHNINPDNFDMWCEFSRQDPSYDENVCETKWQSFRNEHSGAKLGKGSLYHWAKCDNNGKYYEVMTEYLKSKIERSISEGPDAHHLLALVISKYFENQYVCVDINEDWYWFNGVRWKKTMKAHKLKQCIHDDIYKIYQEYGDKYDKMANDLKKHLDDGGDGDLDDVEKYRKKSDKCSTFRKKLYQEPYVTTIIGALKHIFYKEGIMEEFDTNNNLIGFENGIYDLKNHVFREGRPEDNITLSTKIIIPINGSMKPGEKQESYRKRSIPDTAIRLESLNTRVSEMTNFGILDSDMRAFISQIIPNEEVRDYTMRMISSCLSGENREESFNIWTGSGGNGKSKLVELIGLALGEYACNLPVALLTQKRKASGAASPEMARTRGKRFVVMQEPDVNETLNVGEMKEITGNDKIQARGLYKEPFEFTPQFKLFLMCNQLPVVPSDDDGTWRRLRATPFVSRFVKGEDVDIKLNRYPIDKTLKQKLPYWIVPFMLTLLGEWEEYDKNGIIVPAAVTDKTSEYRNANDLIGQWINDCCAQVENTKDGVNEYAPGEFDNLYAEFKEWCSSQEEKNPPEKKAVKEALKKWQASSKFGLSIGKKKVDSGVNGFEMKPRFNLKVV